jgi:hypothetical protein
MESDEHNHVSRRRFLRSIGLAGVVGASGFLLAACGGGSDGSGNGSAAESGDGAGETTASADCSDLSSLSDAKSSSASKW